MNRPEIHLGGTAHSPEEVASICQLGLQFAEIPVLDPDKFLLLRPDYQALREKLGVYYLCHGPQEGNPEDTDALEKTYLPRLIRIISIMPELGMRVLTIHMWMDPRFVTQKAIDCKVGLLRQITQVGSDAGITVCLENLSENANHLAEIFDALPLLYLTLDLGHAQLLSDQNTSIGFIERYPGRIRHIHLHDNLGGNSAADDLHLPVGQGIIDFKKIFRHLKAMGYDRSITLELKAFEIRKCLGCVKELLV